MNQQPENKELSRKKHELQRQSVNFLFQMAFIVAAPALLAAYYGKKIGIENETHPRTMLIFMLLALVFSWIIIFLRFLKFKKDFQQISEDIKRIKKQ